MAERAWKHPSDDAQTTLQLLQWLLRDCPERNFTVELWNGASWEPEKNQFHRFTWKINHPDVLRTALSSSDRQIALAEAYIRGDFDIIGDIEAVFPLADYLRDREWSMAEKLHVLGRLGLPARKRRFGIRDVPHLSGRLHSRERDSQAVRYHYDLSNDFYALWLDHNMVYSCAYFQHENDDLETAQANKLDYLCRKLQLKAGERLLDIGCGWGGLITHAARNYGVHAVGITLSQRQFEWTQNRIQKLGLSRQCEVRLLDYRDLAEPAAYDKLASIGMIEHVGESMLPAYFRQAFGLLRPGGIFLNAGIGRAGRTRPIDGKPAFTDLYIFPDGELVSIGRVLAHAEQAGFEVRDVENLREHYALTLKHWLRRLETQAEAAQRLVGETKFRMWRLYLAGSAYYFQKGWQDLYHTLLLKTRNENSDMPLTRTGWC